ncbi:MAG: PilN domain-containing protein, partial [Polyangiaceae bacterium]|nr:PilN domain-containing protein [Polyangiaceae bacterium]
VGLGILYFRYQGQLDEQNRQNAALSAQIEELRQKSARLEQVQTSLAESQRLESVVSELNKSRTGPIRVMMELGRMLSQGRGPTIDPEALERLRRDNPLAGYNAGWDVRRLWITEFRENQRECRIAGRGRTNEDVAELLRRLSLSELFESVTLTKTMTVNDATLGLAFTGFELTCRVRY